MVFFGYGDLFALSFAMVVMVVQLCVHVYMQPKRDALMNQLDTCTLVLITHVPC